MCSSALQPPTGELKAGKPKFRPSYLKYDALKRILLTSVLRYPPYGPSY